MAVRESIDEPRVVAALYKFVTLENYREMREPLLDVCLEQGIKGTVLLAEEGINGTVSGSRYGIDCLMAYLRNDPRLASLDCKESYHLDQPFLRMKVKLKREIVTMGIPGIDPNKVVGAYVKAKDWNSVIDDPDVVLIDTRNDYEVEIGSFQGAHDPKTVTFREFPQWVRENLDPKEHRKIAMFCTGGIRCEKASSFMMQEGFDEVYHLEGGVLKYLEEVPVEETRWDGECFVFDSRVAVNHRLEKGQYDQCFACRHPITDQDKLSAQYQQGVSCPRCFATLTDDQRARFAERQKQIELAKARGEEHVGAQPPERQSKDRSL